MKKYKSIVKEAKNLQERNLSMDIYYTIEVKQNRDGEIQFYYSQNFINDYDDCIGGLDAETVQEMQMDGYTSDEDYIDRGLDLGEINPKEKYFKYDAYDEYALHTEEYASYIDKQDALTKAKKKVNYFQTNAGGDWSVSVTQLTLEGKGERIIFDESNY